MKSKPPSKESPYRLTVEGNADKHVIIHLLSKSGYDWDDLTKTRPFIDVPNPGGFSGVLESISAGVKTYKRFGIILDADSDLQERWKEIIKAFKSANITIPENPSPQGLILEPPSGEGEYLVERIGVWIMPDNISTGNLESFISELIPITNRCWQYTEEVVAEAINRGAPVSSKRTLEAKVYTWFSWQEDPGIEFGIAIRDRIIHHDQGIAPSLVSWFKNLFLYSNGGT